MDLRLTELQRDLSSAARKFVERELNGGELAGWFWDPDASFDSALIRKVGAAGWLGVMVPDLFGGPGGSAMDCAAVYEQLGRGPFPGPILSTGLVAPSILMNCGSEHQRDALIPRLCRGDDIYTIALSDSSNGWTPSASTVSAVAVDGGIVVDGVKPFVHDAGGADFMLCIVRSDQNLVLVIVDLRASGVNITPLTGFVSKLYQVEFKSVFIPRERILLDKDDVAGRVEAALYEVLPVVAAYKVGACQRIFDLSVEYTNERVVFGKMIGKHQRVQDHCIDMVNFLDAARWITFEALWKQDRDKDAKAAAHEAKAIASEAYYEVCNYANMVFAGPGTALDHILSANTVLSRTLYEYLGSPTFHKLRMVDMLLAEPVSTSMDV